MPHFTCRVHCKNGNYRWFETTLKIARDEQGNILQIYGIGRDVSEQMNLQESFTFQEFITFIHPEDKEVVIQSTKKCIETGQSFEGEGIPQERISRLGDPFYTPKAGGGEGRSWTYGLP